MGPLKAQHSLELYQVKDGCLTTRFLDNHHIVHQIDSCYGQGMAQPIRSRRSLIDGLSIAWT